MSVSEKKPSMLSTEEQLEMLAAIENYRVSLPEKKFAVKKNHLPEIIASNVSVQQRFWMDHMKKKAPRMKYKYYPVGLVDGTVRTDTSTDDKFSIENKLRFIQRSASAQRIEALRTQYDKLIVTPKKHTESAAVPWDPLQSALKKMKAGTEEPVVIKANHCFTEDNW